MLRSAVPNIIVSARKRSLPTGNRTISSERSFPIKLIIAGVETDLYSVRGALVAEFLFLARSLRSLNCVTPQPSVHIAGYGYYRTGAPPLCACACAPGRGVAYSHTSCPT